MALRPGPAARPGPGAGRLTRTRSAGGSDGPWGPVGRPLPWPVSGTGRLRTARAAPRSCDSDISIRIAGRSPTRAWSGLRRDPPTRDSGAAAPGPRALHRARPGPAVRLGAAGGRGGWADEVLSHRRQLCLRRRGRGGTGGGASGTAPGASSESPLPRPKRDHAGAAHVPGLSRPSHVPPTSLSRSVVTYHPRAPSQQGSSTRGRRAAGGAQRRTARGGARRGGGTRGIHGGARAARGGAQPGARGGAGARPAWALAVARGAARGGARRASPCSGPAGTGPAASAWSARRVTGWPGPRHGDAGQERGGGGGAPSALRVRRAARHAR
jgi:hypothetical protein